MSALYSRRVSLLLSQRHRPASCRFNSNDSRPSSLPSNNSTSIIALEYGVNPPRTTRPAVLNYPDPLSSPATLKAKAKRLLAIGRAYASFYKTGLKNVYHNYRASVPIRRVLGLSPYLPNSPFPTPPASTTAVADHKTVAFRNAIHSFNISRSHFQLVCRAANDARRMIPFALLLILADELTPILIPLIGNTIIPITCWIPSQFTRERKVRATRKHGALVAHYGQNAESPPWLAGSQEELDLLAKHYADAKWVETTASSEEVLRACAVFSLVKAHDRWGRLPLVSSVYRPRLRRYIEYLDLDDTLIRRSGGVDAMEAGEVRISVEERGGVDILQEKEGEEAEQLERVWLKRWLQSRET